MINRKFKMPVLLVQICLISTLSLSVSFVQSQSLPDVFTLFSGEKVKTKSDWYTKRQPEIIRFFENEVYGKIPSTDGLSFHYQILEEETQILKGKAYRRQVRMYIVNNRTDTISVDLLVYYPVAAKKAPVPVFTLLNYGNHTLSEDTLIQLSASKLYTIEQKRASFIRRFPIEAIIDSGCGVITSCYEDFIPDNDSLYRKTIQSYYGILPESSGAISVWAWAYSRMVDYALEQPVFDSEKIAAIGHSRTGKAALWAAVNDIRIKYALVNESGNTGAKLNFHYSPKAESIKKINTGFPFWFSMNYKKNNQRDSLRTLPYDQHWLVASVAPRHVYVADAKQDYWSDPEGEFLALKEAEKVYKFLGLKSKLPPQMPKVRDATTKGLCGYHIREGVHDLLPEDWSHYIKFIKQ
jgi:hypothetical protein